MNTLVPLGQKSRCYCRTVWTDLKEWALLWKKYLSVGVDDWLAECAIIASNGYDLQFS